MSKEPKKLLLHVMIFLQKDSVYLWKVILTSSLMRKLFQSITNLSVGTCLVQWVQTYLKVMTSVLSHSYFQIKMAALELKPVAILVPPLMRNFLQLCV